MAYPLADVAPIIDEMDMGPLTFTRMGPRTVNSFGGASAGNQTAFAITPIVAHTVSGRDLDAVPEAYRNTEVVRFYALNRSWPAGQARGWRVADGGENSDRQAYNGRTYKIINSEGYDMQARVWMALGALEDTQAQP